MGGMDLRKIIHVSQALRRKLIWKLAKEEDKEWIKVYQAQYLQQSNSILIIENPPYGSPCWNGLMQIKYLITKYISWDLGSRDSIYFQEDAWLKSKPLMRYNKFQKGAKWTIVNQGDKIVDYYDKNEAKWIIKQAPENQIEKQLNKFRKKLKRLKEKPSN